MNKLTKRQLGVYGVLLSVGDMWISQEDIYKCLPNMYTPPTNNFHNSTGRTIAKDIQALKKHPDITCVILSGTFGHKIATEEEAKMYFENKRISLGKQYQMLLTLQKKAGMNGQTLLLPADEEPRTIKAFVN